jgi:hypothetical protein
MVDLMKDHMLKAHQGTWQCHECDQNTSSSTTIWAHYRAKHLDKKLWGCAHGFHCYQNDAEASVWKHMYDAHDILTSKTLICKYHKRTFWNDWQFKQHKRTCGVTEKLIPCPKCDDKGFNTDKGLLAHLKAKHPDHEVKTCVCGEHHYTDASWKAHKRVCQKFLKAAGNFRPREGEAAAAVLEQENEVGADKQNGAEPPLPNLP